jgi:hypothetical protein
MPDIFSAIRQQTTEWLAASGYHRSDLAKELKWSESFLSEFMSGKSGLGGLALCQLTAVVSQPPKVNKFNKGARICSAQSMGRTIKGVLELNEANMAEFADKHTETIHDRMTAAIHAHNKNTPYDLSR